MNIGSASESVIKMSIFSIGNTFERVTLPNFVESDLFGHLNHCGLLILLKVNKLISNFIMLPAGSH